MIPKSGSVRPVRIRIQKSKSRRIHVDEKHWVLSVTVCGWEWTLAPVFRILINLIRTNRPKSGFFRNPTNVILSPCILDYHGMRWSPAWTVANLFLPVPLVRYTGDHECEDRLPELYKPFVITYSSCIQIDHGFKDCLRELWLSFCS